MAVLDSSQPLALPKGSIRAIIALAFTLTTLALFAVRGSVDVALLGITTLIVGNYFGQRNGVALAEAPLEKPYLPGSGDEAN